MLAEAAVWVGGRKQGRGDWAGEEKGGGGGDGCAHGRGAGREGRGQAVVVYGVRGYHAGGGLE